MKRKLQCFGNAALAVFLSVGVLGAQLHAEECKPVKWGADDEIGSANLITPKSVLLASQLIKKGKTQHLGIIIDNDTPAFGPRSLNLQIVQPAQEWGREAFPNGFN